MKKSVILFQFLFSFFLLNGQILESQIKFDLYFTDAVGNMDTVRVGYDSLGTAGFNVEFGEIDLSGIPFDSEFEVRGCDISGYQVQCNPTVQYYTPIWCEEWPWTQYQSVIIRANNWPITISWDRSYFLDECYDWTHFTRSWNYVHHPGFLNNDTQKLIDMDSWTITKQYMQATNGFLNNRTEATLDGGQDSVYVIWIGLAGNMPTDILATNTPPIHETSVYPNPLNWSNLTVRIPDNLKNLKVQSIQLSDIASKVAWIEDWNTRGTDVNFNCDYLENGFYLGKIHFNDGRELFFKFVKSY